jgi:4-oxalomesaconate tautomerase
MTGRGIRCMLMRGGTSRGAYFLAGDLPADQGSRDAVLLDIMGSPDPRQVDGIGGGHPLTSKVAVVSPAADGDADVDYLFLQVGVTEPVVSDRQNCGNLLAGVAPFAIERGLMSDYPVRIRMVNSGEIAVATQPEPGVFVLAFARGSGGAGGLLPTGHVRDCFTGVDVTCVDNGMPVVLVAAADLGKSGYESVASLEGDADLAARVRAIRLEAGRRMGLGDVSSATIPKVCLVAGPKDGGTICTRTFIPVRVHESVGVFGAISVVSALLTDGAVGRDLTVLAPGQTRFDVEHPAGHLQVEVSLDPPRAGAVRTARKLFDGIVFPREA